jgi:hypothetical protein
MIRPQDLEKLDRTVPRLPFGFVKNANWMLTIGKILLQVNRLVINCTAWIFETLLEL